MNGLEIIAIVLTTKSFLQDSKLFSIYKNKALQGKKLCFTSSYSEMEPVKSLRITEDNELVFIEMVDTRFTMGEHVSINQFENTHADYDYE